MAKRPVTVLQGTPPLLLGRLAQISVADDEVEGRRRLTARLAWVLGLLGFGGLFIAPPLGILFLVGSVASIVFWSQYRAQDLDDDRLRLVEDVVRAIQPDLSEKAPAEVTLQHGDCFHFGAVSNQRTEGSFATGRVNFSEYEDSWLAMKGKLRDGSVLKLEVAEEAKRKARPKRKYTKTKDRIRETVDVALRVSPEAYPHLERLQGSLDPQKLVQHAGLAMTGVTVQGPLVRLRAATGVRLRQTLRTGPVESGGEHRLTGPKLVSLLAFLYGGLSYCRPDPAPAAAGDARNGQ